MSHISKEEEKIKLGLIKAIQYINLYNWEKDEYKRFCYLKDAFLIATEFTPTAFIKEHIWKKTSDQSILAKIKLLKITRHLLSHYPFFSSWDEIFIDYEMMKGGQIISYFEWIDKSPIHIQYQYISWEEVNCEICIPPLWPNWRFFFNEMFKFTENRFSNDKNAPLVVMTMIALTLFQEYIRSIPGLDKKLSIHWENT